MPLYYNTCVICGQKFKSTRRGALTDTDNCRKQLSRNRKRINKQAAAAISTINELHDLVGDPVYASQAQTLLEKIFFESGEAMIAFERVENVGGDWYLVVAKDEQVFLTELPRKK